MPQSIWRSEDQLQVPHFHYVSPWDETLTSSGLEAGTIIYWAILLA